MDKSNLVEIAHWVGVAYYYSDTLEQALKYVNDRHPNIDSLIIESMWTAIDVYIEVNS